MVHKDDPQSSSTRAAGSPNAASRGSLWNRLTDFFRPPAEAAPAPVVARNSLEWRVDPDTESWHHLPPDNPAGMQEVRVCAPDGYDFARLVWQACEVCRRGLILKIRVTGPWQRYGYGSRMVRFALRGQDGYAWTTTPQTKEAQAFFPAFTAATGVAFPRQPSPCEHMREGQGPQHAEARQFDPPA